MPNQTNKTLRILITGSRTFTNYNAISRTLKTYDKFKPALVSGHCNKGADYLCEKYARSHGWGIEIHPADWNQYGKRAGIIRNLEMVKSKPDITIAFVSTCYCNREIEPHISHGTNYTIETSRKYGIDTIVIAS